MLKRRILKAIKEAGMEGTSNPFRKAWRLCFWLWFEIKWDVIETTLKKTANWRIKHSKKLILKSEHLYTKPSMWDDVEVCDQWGFWVPFGFGICSYGMWEEDDKFNAENNWERTPFQEMIEGDGWDTYYSKEKFLSMDFYFEAARKHLAKRMGTVAYTKELELQQVAASKEWLDKEQQQYLEWVQGGMKPYDIHFTEHCKEDLKGILGEEDATKLIENYDADEIKKRLKPDEPK